MYEDLIFKRLDRVGNICSKDLVDILGVSAVHASRMLGEFYENNKNNLVKEGKYIKLHPQGKIKQSILAQSLVDEINSQKNIPTITGILDNEFKISSNTIVNNSKIDIFVKKILQAMKKDKSVEVVYVSLTKKSSLEEKDPVRQIMPISFRFFEGLLYLLAVDVKNKRTEGDIKMFSLSRFQYLEIIHDKIKYTLDSINIEKKTKLILTFNSEFTLSQKQIIIEELQLKEYDNSRYYVNIYNYEKFSFLKKYFSNEKPDIKSKSIYPFFVNKEEREL